MRWLKVAVAGGGLVAAVLLWAAPAGAEVDGSCTATVAGEDVGSRSSSSTGDAIEVDAKETIQVGASSGSAIEGYKVRMSFAGFEWQVAEGPGEGNSWSKTVDVADYARFGVGYYRVEGESLGAAPCTGAVLVKITGKSPLTTVAGMVGLALTVVSAAGATASVRKAIKLGPKLEHGGSQFTDADGTVSLIHRAYSPLSYVQSVEAAAAAGADAGSVSSAASSLQGRF